MNTLVLYYVGFEEEADRYTRYLTFLKTNHEDYKCKYQHICQL